MNGVSLTSRWVAIAVLTLIGIVAVAPESRADVAEAGEPVQAAASVETTVSADSEQKEDAPKVLRDPFNPAPPESANSSVAAAPLRPRKEFFADLELKGIFLAEGYGPSALVRIGGENVSQIVREGDLVTPRTLDRRRGNPDSKEYLLIVKIESDSITVASKERPDETVTIR
ncbi:MAG: hypothetical protein Q7Q73_02140 [Verrucomicrobiota bacterium JB024]|nr:hypothetical protein [Verrucomicrobiota bacterium JB024]